MHGVWHLCNFFFLVIYCRAPPTLANGVTVVQPHTTTLSSVIFYQCQQSGFTPSSNSSVCEEDGAWSPDPSQVACVMIPGTLIEIIHHTPNYSYCFSSLLFNICRIPLCGGWLFYTLMLPGYILISPMVSPLILCWICQFHSKKIYRLKCLDFVTCPMLQQYLPLTKVVITKLTLHFNFLSSLVGK